MTWTHRLPYQRWVGIMRMPHAPLENSGEGPMYSQRIDLTEKQNLPFMHILIVYFMNEYAYTYNLKSSMTNSFQIHKTFLGRY